MSIWGFNLSIAIFRGLEICTYGGKKNILYPTNVFYKDHLPTNNVEIQE